MYEFSNPKDAVKMLKESVTLYEQRNPGELPTPGTCIDLPAAAERMGIYPDEARYREVVNYMEELEVVQGATEDSSGGRMSHTITWRGLQMLGLL